MKEQLATSWDKVIDNYFNQGMIAYERQLQVYFFLELQRSMPEYAIWIEPMMFLHKKYIPTKRPTLDGKIPDMVISKDNKIKAVVELKCSPWGFVKYEKDIEKLKYFENLASDHSIKIPLSWPPKSSIWNNQISSLDGEMLYEFDPDVLMVFGVIARENAEALKPTINSDIKNFLHLTHWIEKKSE